MIIFVKKILQKLISDVEGYHVSCIETDNAFKIYFNWKNTPYTLFIGKDYISFGVYSEYMNFPAEVSIELTKDDKYDILSLVQKLRKSLKDYASMQLETFADFSSTDDNSDLND